MNDSITPPRKTGRPPLPKEMHRRTINVRLSPALLDRVTTAAAAKGHSISREVEERCEKCEVFELLLNADTDIKTMGSYLRRPRQIRKLAGGGVDFMIIRLPHHPNEGDDQ